MNGIKLTIDTPTQNNDVAKVDSYALTQEEEKAINDFKHQINLSNPGVIMHYGSGVQKKIADFSESTLKKVKTKDLGEIGNLLTDVVGELKAFDQPERRGVFGVLTKKKHQLETMKSKFDNAETNITKITDTMEDHKIKLEQDINLFEELFQINHEYFKELSMYIVAGQQKLDEVRSGELAELLEKANQSGRPEDLQTAKDLDDQCNRFEKKLHDLSLTRSIALQTAPQIRLLQSNNIVMVEKISSTLTQTVPLWKQQMVLALGVENAAKAAKAQAAVSDLTNDLLRRNAETLKMATIETAKESERSIISIDTLKSTNENLISTLQEVLKIQEDGRKDRAAAEESIALVESELKSSLLEMQTNPQIESNSSLRIITRK